MPLAGICSWVMPFISVDSDMGALGWFLVVVLLNGGHDGVAGRADELGAVLGGPVAAGRQSLRAALELRGHVAGDELVGVAGGCGVRPFVPHEQEGAEAIGLGAQ